MPLSLIPSFLSYSIISGITPGPANLCSFSAAIRYGKKAALRQWRGLFLGYALVSITAAIVTYLFGTAFQDYLWIFSIVGFAYIIWLALHILWSKPDAKETGTGDCSMKTGFLVQITNVKIMIFCVTALGAYVLPYQQSLPALLSVAVILPFIGPVANLVWILAGAALKNIFAKYQKILNIVMAVALILCAFRLLFP